MNPDLARVGSMIGEPARAAMLSALLGGQSLAAGVLARAAGVSPATASAHLARLLECGLLTRRSAGRERHYALANADVAAALEALARIAPARTDAKGKNAQPDATLRFARTCYDHLAGQLGVLLTDTLLEQGIIKGRSHYELTEQGAAWLLDFGIDMDVLQQNRRPLVRPCLDWSERRDHVAGSVGAAIATTLLERRWIVRLEGTRAVRLTLRGREGLYRALGLGI